MQSRRYLATTVAAVLAMASLAACGGGSTGGSAGGKKKVTLIQGVANEPFYISMYCGAKEAASQAGVDLDVVAPAKWDTPMQQTVVDGVTAKKPDAVLIAPVDKEAMANSVKQLAGNGSKVVFVDTELTDASVGVSRISSDNALGGKLGAQALAKQIGDKGKVIVLAPKKGIATTDDRVTGFKDEMKNHPNISVVSEQYPGDDAAKSQEVVSATLAANPDLAGVFASNLVTGEGAATALKSGNKVGGVKLVEFDASPAQVDALKAGTIQALISQEPLEIGRKGIEQAVNALNGKPTESRIKTELIEVNASNVGDANVAKYLYRKDC